MFLLSKTSTTATTPTITARGGVSSRLLFQAFLRPTATAPSMLPLQVPPSRPTSHSSLSLLSLPRQQFFSTTTTTTTTTAGNGGGGGGSGGSLDEFRDLIPREVRMREPVGRSWTVKELRRKSFDDLHKLWHVLYKEKNMLLTESALSRRHLLLMPQPERLQKVKKSMGAIRRVLGDRKNDHLASLALKNMPKEGDDEDDDEGEEEDIEGEEEEEEQDDDKRSSTTPK